MHISLTDLTIASYDTINSDQYSVKIDKYSWMYIHDYTSFSDIVTCDIDRMSFNNEAN